MFNRKLQVSVVKDNTKPPSQDPDKDPTYSPEAISDSVQQVIDKVGRTVVTAFLIIIAADTARQVIIKQTKEG